MKILIVSLPRTGSTNLMYTLAKENGIKDLFEPFDGSNRVMYHEKMDNIVLKTIVDQQPDHNVEYLEFINDLIGKFDKVILLSRKNLQECAESHAYFVHNKGKDGFTSTSEYFWEPTPVDNLCLKNIIRWNGILEKISDLYKIPITYYEDIYDTKSFKRLRKGNRKDVKKNII